MPEKRKKKKYKLSKTEIIRKKETIEHLLKDGIRLKGKFCIVYCERGCGRQVVFILPKRVGKAVLRNKVKRWMREIYRIHRDIAGNNFTMAITMPFFRENVSYNRIKGDIIELFKMVGKFINS